MEQQPGGESVIEDLAKPVARTMAWGAVAAALAALVAGARRNLRGG